MLFKKKEEKLIHLRNNLLVIIIILGLIFVVYSIIKQKERKDIAAIDKFAKIEEKNEIEKLKAGNKKIIENAKSLTSQRVRGIDETDNYWGNLEAPVQIIIYDDFECPFCAKFQESVEKAKDEFVGKIVIAFRHFPLRMHPNAVPAAMAAECAGEQGSFWEMHDRLFTANLEHNMSKDQYISDAKDVGLDSVEFLKCFDTNKYKEKIQKQLLEGRNYGVTGTPGNFINGEPAPGAVPYEDYKSSDGILQKGLKSLIEKHLAE